MNLQDELRDDVFQKTYQISIEPNRTYKVTKRLNEYFIEVTDDEGNTSPIGIVSFMNNFTEVEKPLLTLDDVEVDMKLRFIGDNGAWIKGMEYTVFSVNRVARTVNVKAWYAIPEELIGYFEIVEATDATDEPYGEPPEVLVFQVGLDEPDEDGSGFIPDEALQYLKEIDNGTLYTTGDSLPFKMVDIGGIDNIVVTLQSINTERKISLANFQSLYKKVGESEKSVDSSKKYKSVDSSKKYKRIYGGGIFSVTDIITKSDEVVQILLTSDDDSVIDNPRVNYSRFWTFYEECEPTPEPFEGYKVEILYIGDIYENSNTGVKYTIIKAGGGMVNLNALSTDVVKEIGVNDQNFKEHFKKCFTPKVGEMVYSARFNANCQYIDVTSDGNYALWNTDKTLVIYVDKIEPEHKDIHAELKKAFSDGAKIEIFQKGEWVLVTRFSGRILWENSAEYRIKGDISLDVWKDCNSYIKAFWQGADIICLVNGDGDLMKQVTKESDFEVGAEYRSLTVLK